MIKMAYLQGARDALQKFALDPEMALHFADLAGLGLIAAPVVHDVFAKDPEEISPEAKRFKHLSDLAGVGILAGTTGYKAHQLAQALKAGTTLVPKH